MRGNQCLDAQEPVRRAQHLVAQILEAMRRNQHLAAWDLRTRTRHQPVQVPRMRRTWPCWNRHRGRGLSTEDVILVFWGFFSILICLALVVNKALHFGSNLLDFTQQKELTRNESSRLFSFCCSSGKKRKSKYSVGVKCWGSRQTSKASVTTNVSAPEPAGGLASPPELAGHLSPIPESTTRRLCPRRQCPSILFLSQLSWGYAWQSSHLPTEETLWVLQDCKGFCQHSCP